MVDSKKLISDFLNNIREDIIADLKAKDISNGDLDMKVAAQEDEGELSGADYYYYLVNGRRPGKQPPPESILAWMQSKGIHGDYISDKSLAYLIGRKIGQLGTDIYLHKRPGLSLAEIIETNNKEFADNLRVTYLTEIKNTFSESLKEVFA